MVIIPIMANTPIVETTPKFAPSCCDRPMFCANNAAKDQQKAGDFSEDDLKRIEDLVQKETDYFIGLVDAELKQKEEDLIEI